MLVVDVYAKNIWTFITAFTKQRHRGEDVESGYRELRESRPVPPPLEKVPIQHTLTVTWFKIRPAGGHGGAAGVPPGEGEARAPALGRQRVVRGGGGQPRPGLRHREPE